jgi:hypothetical protein
MKATEGTVYCWVVHSGPRKWKAFRNRRDARKYRNEQGGILYCVIRSH